jgi:hypothetical protein
MGEQTSLMQILIAVSLLSIALLVYTKLVIAPVLARFA